MQLDACVAHQYFCQKVEQRSPVRFAQEVDVAQECAQQSPTSKDPDTSSNAPWMPIENNRGINGSPCSPPSAQHCSPIPFVIDPIVRGRFGIGQHHERDECLRIWHLFESAQHCSAQDMIVGSNPVDTQDCSPRIGICGSSEQMPDAVGARPGRESALEWRALFLENPSRIALPASSR